MFRVLGIYNFAQTLDFFWLVPTYSSGPNKHVLTLIYSHKKIAPTFILSPKIRFDIFLKSCISPIKSEHNVPTTRLFRTTQSFGPIKKPSSAFLPKNADKQKILLEYD